MSHYPFVLNIGKEVESEEILDMEVYALGFLDAESFVAGGYWAGGKCDWFTIGGRFTSLFNNNSVIQYIGQEDIKKLCHKLSEQEDYLDIEYNEKDLPQKGDWLVMVDYHL